jgi:hypothetical protein
MASNHNLGPAKQRDSSAVAAPAVASYGAAAILAYQQACIAAQSLTYPANQTALNAAAAARDKALDPGAIISY